MCFVLWKRFGLSLYVLIIEQYHTCNMAQAIDEITFCPFKIFFFKFIFQINHYFYGLFKSSNKI